MLRSAWTRNLLCAALVASLCTSFIGPAFSSESEAPAMGIQASLDESRELIKSGDYDQAIALLRDAIERGRPNPEELRYAYLLLIETLVFKGNSDRRKPQGQHDAQLNYEEAKRLIAECISTKNLRHTRPEPETEYPADMVAFFKEVRGRLQGGLTVTELEPSTASVILDADTLRASSTDGALTITDLSVGAHTIVVQAHGYASVVETVTIAPGANNQLSYSLRRNRGTWWYATRVGALGGLIAALIIANQPNASGEPTPQALPGPPPPPGQPGR